MLFIASRYLGRVDASNSKREYLLGMKTERKRTKLSGATFIFIFLCRSRNEYRNTGNKDENGYFQK
jgi:hypothetical protein